jgi:hypothetical protein
VFENRVLRRTFGPKRDEVTGGWRKLHNEELRNMYCSPSIIRMIKSRKIRWTGNVARMGRRGMHVRYWWESQKKRDLWEGQDVGEWIMAHIRTMQQLRSRMKIKNLFSKSFWECLLHSVQNQFPANILPTEIKLY